MMDHFHEEVVVKRNRLVNEITYYLSMAVMIFSGLLAFMQIQGLLRVIVSGQAGTNPMGLAVEILITLALAGAAVAIFLFRDRLRTEYEYTFTNGVLDFAEVYNNKKRKDLGSLNVRKNMEAFGPVNGSAFQRYLSMNDCKQMRWFLNRDGNLYYFYYQKSGEKGAGDSGKRLIIFEPSDELVGMIRQYLPHGAWQE